MEKISISTEYIKLGSFMKLANLCMSGGEAKNVINDSLVTVNGEICTMRGKKLHAGDIVCYNGRTAAVSDES